MIFQYHPDGAEELRRSVLFYEEKSEGLGEEFLHEVEETIHQALKYPMAGEVIRSDVRKMILNRFPFELVYVVDSDVLTIIAIKHTSRKPHYWMSRVIRPL